DAYASNTGDISQYNGHVYTNKAPGLSFIGAIPYALLYPFEHHPKDPLVLALNVYICTILCVALLGAMVPLILYRVAREQGIAAPWAAIVALAVALATQLFPYATLFVTAVPSGALMLVALTMRRRAWAGAAAGIATTMNYLCGPALLLFGLAGPRRIRFFAGAAPPLIAMAIYQKICCGSFFRTPISTMDPRFVNPDATLGIMQRPSLQALYGITVSPYRGLFFFAPVLILALVGFFYWFRAAQPVLPITVALITIFFFAFNVSFNGWEGGFGIGARYLVPLIPLWGLAMLHLGRRWRAAFVALAGLSFAINFAATAVDPQPSGTIPRPLTQYIVPLLIHGHFSPEVPITPPWSAATFTGHTSVNRMTFDEAVVFARHPPGSDAAEWASFNLGESFFGAGDARSLIPIAIVILAAMGAGLRFSIFSPPSRENRKSQT
ncbi:MAG TPA: hypothetical protein VII12_08710, partial [Thermoanaerobaculia bacterium]